MDQLDQKMLALYKEVKRKEKILLHIDQVKEKIAACSAKLTTIEEELDRLGFNIQKLQHSGIEKIRNMLFPKSEDKFENLKIDYFVQFMNYKSLKKEIELYHFEMTVLESQLKSLENVEYKLQKKIWEKEAELIEKKEKSVGQILQVQDDIFYHEVLIEEIQEALLFGENALKALDLIIGDLKTVLAGRRFEMYGQGRYSTWEKIEYFEKTKKNIDQVYHWLQRFNFELKDVSIHFRIDYFDEIKKFEKFIDELPEVLVNSSIVKVALENFLSKLRFVRGNVKATLDKLLEEIEKAEMMVKKLQKEIESIIINRIEKG